MKKWFLGCVAGLLVMAPVSALAQAGAPADPKKVLSASGVVSAVTDTSVTVKGKTAEWTFAVDKDTKLVAPGASRKTGELKSAEKPRIISEFIKVGDTVAVKYHDMGDSKHAADIRVTKPAPAAAK